VSALSLESCTDGVGFLSKPELEVSALYSTVITSQVVLDSLALLLVDARSSPLNLASNTKEFCCILCGPGGKRIVNVVPGGTELELQVKTGSWANCTHWQ